MSSEDTQEKRHQPTKSKLKRARREGNVPHARDVMAMTTWPTLLWIYFNWPSFEASLKRLISAVVTADLNMPAEDAVGRIAGGVLSEAYAIIIPIMLVAALMAIVISIIDTGGIIFAAKPVAPDFDRINPAKGIKRIFSRRTAVESAYGLLKLALFALVTVAIISTAVEVLRQTQACGVPCLPAALAATVDPLLAIFLAFFLIAAVADFLLGRSLFRHEMRMSDTELKRENKDVYGNPELKRHRRERGAEMASGPSRLGLRAATFVVVGRDQVVGVRYMPAEAPAPFVVVKAQGRARTDLLSEARRLGISRVANERLAALLHARGTPGDIVPPDSFADIAREILRLERA